MTFTYEQVKPFIGYYGDGEEPYTLRVSAKDPEFYDILDRDGTFRGVVMDSLASQPGIGLLPPRG